MHLSEVAGRQTGRQCEDKNLSVTVHLKRLGKLKSQRTQRYLIQTTSNVIASLFNEV